MKSKLLFSLIALTLFLGGCSKDDNGPKEPTVTGKWKATGYRTVFTNLLNNTSTDTAGKMPGIIYLNFQTDRQYKLTKEDSSGVTTYTATGNYQAHKNKIELINFYTDLDYYMADAYYIDTLTANRMVLRDTVVYQFNTLRMIKTIIAER